MVPDCLREIEIQTDTLLIRALEGGSPEGHPVLALHGWLDNASSFIPLAPHLINDVRLIALDLPGHGYSEHRPLGVAYHFLDWVPLVMDVATALGLERFSLMGHSMGAGISSLVAGTFPERVDTAIFLEGLGPLSGRPEDGPDTLKRHVAYGQRVRNRPLTPYPSREEGAAILQGATGMSTEAAALLVSRGMKEVEGGYIWRSDPRMRQPSASRLSEDQVVAFLKHIVAPSIFVAATSGFPFDDESVRRRREAIPHLEVERLEGNHHVHMESPEAVATLIRPFLRSSPG